MNRIRIDDRWSISRTPHGWDLHETMPGMTRPRDGSEPQPTETTTTYHYGRLDHSLMAIVGDAPGEGAATAQDILDAISSVGARVLLAVRHILPAAEAARTDDEAAAGGMSFDAAHYGGAS